MLEQSPPEATPTRPPDPAAIKAEHEWHHQTCAVLLSPDPLTLIHCLPYLLADALVKAQQREQRARGQVDQLVSRLTAIRSAWDDYTTGIVNEPTVERAIGFDHVPALDGPQGGGS